MFIHKSLLSFLVSLLFLTSGGILSTTAHPPKEPVFVQEFLGQVDFVEGRLTQLAEAMPEDTYNWRPGDGVRSVGETYLHVAFGNYIWVTLSGGKVPEEVGFVFDPAKIKEWDSQTTNKKEIIEIMKRSFDLLRETAKTITEEDLEREVEFFGMKFSLRNFLVTGIAHEHEHLGQSIAYARMNGVTPPWSEGEGTGG